MLRSLSLFSTTIILFAVALIAVTTVRTWNLGKARFGRFVADAAAPRISAIPALRRLASADADERSRAGQVLMIGTGVTITAIALALAWIASYVPVSTYLFLFLLGSGLLLL